MSRQTIQKLVAVTPPDALRILDLNLRAPFYIVDTIREALHLANMLKMNEDELAELSSMLNSPAAKWIGSGPFRIAMN